MRSMGVRYCIGVLCDGICEMMEEEMMKRDLVWFLVYIQIWRNGLVEFGSQVLL